MADQAAGIDPSKVLMHEAFNKVLELMRTEPISQISYLLGRFDAYAMMSEGLGILNQDELKVLREQLDAIPSQRTASGLD